MIDNKIHEVIDELKSFIYCDEVEISRLYNQLFPNILEQTVVYENQDKGSFKGTVGGAVFEIVNLDGVFSYSYNKNLNNKFRTILILEQKANILVKHICDNCAKSIDENIDVLKKKNTFRIKEIVVEYATFELTHIYDGEENLLDLRRLPYNFNKKDATFILESGCRKLLEELSVGEDADYYETYSAKCGKYAIEMYMSGDKICRGMKHLTHLIKRGKSFRWFVLGELTHIGDIYYSIKPIVVW